MSRFITPWCTCGDKGAAMLCEEPGEKCVSCGFRAAIRDKRLKEIRTHGLTEMKNGLRGLIIRKEEE